MNQDRKCPANSTRTYFLLLGILQLPLPALGATPAGTHLWYTDFSHELLSPWNTPAVGTEGLLYFGMGHDFHAVDAETGLKVWTYVTDGGLIHGSPAVGPDGSVYFGAQDQRLYSLDGKTGRTRWIYQTYSGIVCTPAIGDNGVVYFGNGEGWVYAVETSTGRGLWSFYTGATIGWASPVIGKYGLVYVPCFNGNLYALDMETGEMAWFFWTGGALAFSTPAIGPDGTLYFGSENGLVYAVDGRTGQMVWSVRSGGGVHSSPAVGNDGKVYLSTPNGWYEDSDLREQWDNDENDFYLEVDPFEAYELNKGLREFELINTEYPQNQIPKGGIYALDGQTGQTLWARNSYSAYASPVIGPDGTLYYQSMKLYMLDSQTGDTLWESSGRSQRNKPVVGPDGTVYALWRGKKGSDIASVYALEGTTRIDPDGGNPSDGHSHENTDGHWEYNPWFGPVFHNEGDPWIYHAFHGWLYSPGYIEDGSFWSWDKELGWIWTSPDSYPFIYQESRGWLYYQEGTSSPRWLYDFQASIWTARI